MSPSENSRRAAQDRALACASYRAAGTLVGELQRRGELVDTVARYADRRGADNAPCARLRAKWSIENPLG